MNNASYKEIDKTSRQLANLKKKMIKANKKKIQGGGARVPLPHLMDPSNRMVTEYFPSLNWAKMRYGLSKGWKMLDKESNDRLKYCLNKSHERIKRVTKSVSKTGYLYTTRDSLLRHQPNYEKTAEFRGLIDDCPVDGIPIFDSRTREMLPGSVRERTKLWAIEKYKKLFPGWHGVMDEERYNFSSKAQHTLTSFYDSEHIMLIKSTTNGPTLAKEVLGSIVGFILGISPELYYFGILGQYIYLIFKKYDNMPGPFEPAPGGRLVEHGSHEDHEEGRKNLVKDDSTGKWYFIDMAQFDFDHDFYMIYG